MVKEKGEITSMSLAKKGGGMSLFWGVSADTVFLWANWIFVGTLIIGVLATFAIIISGRDRDRLAKIEISQAQSDAAKARQETQAVKAANLKLEAQIAPRRLSSEQQTELATLLKRFKGQKIRIESYALDAEGEILAGQIRNGLSQIFKIDDWVGSEEAGNGFIKGINITGVNADLVGALKDTFNKLGLKNVTTAPLPEPTVILMALEQSRSKAKDVAVEIVVGLSQLNRRYDIYHLDPVQIPASS